MDEKNQGAEGAEEKTPGELAFEKLSKELSAKASTAVSITVPLGVPFKVAGAETSELTLRRLTVGQMLEAKSDADCGQAGLGIQMLSRMSGVHPDDLLNLDQSDFMLLMEVAGNFPGGRVSRG